MSHSERVRPELLEAVARARRLADRSRGRGAMQDEDLEWCFHRRPVFDPEVGVPVRPRGRVPIRSGHECREHRRRKSDEDRTMQGGGRIRR